MEEFLLLVHVPVDRVGKVTQVEMKDVHLDNQHDDAGAQHHRQKYLYHQR
jgi:hypothetical protein